MGRAKLRMELISKDKTRNTTYQKRKEGIKKKAKELSTLCAVDIGIIIYPPDSNVPEIWPENDYDHFKKTIANYKSKNGETSRRTYDLKDFFEDRSKKIEDELLKARKRNLEAKYATWFEELNGLNELQLREFAMYLQTKEDQVRNHLDLMKRNMNIQLQQPMYNVMPGYDNKHPGMVQYPGMGMGLDHHVQLVNCYDDYYGCFNNDAMTSLMKFDQPIYEGGVVYNDTLNQWAIQQPMMHGGMLNDASVMHELEGDVKNDEDVINDNQERFG
ncbi:uncharacterized protein [Rutidosis leptorrhynchoides]|uniref:uncharacterized protein n=1 Tax=Rutidosis leptorrhynchoides TaxID=125765 RepID=UPI003A993A6C